MKSNDRPAASPERSRVVMTEIVMPQDTNNHGHLFGGRALALADKCAAIVALRHTRLPVVTASIDRVDFIRPINSGMIVVLTGQANATFRSSMEVGVTVEGEDPSTGTRTLSCTALLTFVALDDDGKPIPIPPLELLTDDDRKRAEEAQARRKVRLETSAARRRANE